MLGFVATVLVTGSLGLLTFINVSSMVIQPQVHWDTPLVAGGLVVLLLASAVGSVLIRRALRGALSHVVTLGVAAVVASLFRVGQMLIVLAEALGHLRFEILASDISSRVLDTARRALYPIEDAENIPRALRARYCLKGIGPQEGWFMLDKPIRDRVRFEQINLNNRLPDLGSFDVIFLRNVMIYFSPETKQGVLTRLMPALRPGGHFFISHSESLHGVTDQLRMIKPSIYCKPPG